MIVDGPGRDNLRRSTAKTVIILLIAAFINFTNGCTSCHLQRHSRFWYNVSSAAGKVREIVPAVVRGQTGPPPCVLNAVYTCLSCSIRQGPRPGRWVGFWRSRQESGLLEGRLGLYDLGRKNRLQCLVIGPFFSNWGVQGCESLEAMEDPLSSVISRSAAEHTLNTLIVETSTCGAVSGWYFTILVWHQLRGDLHTTPKCMQPRGSCGYPTRGPDNRHSN